MTDTTVLDAMMRTLERNPMTPERLGQLGPKNVKPGEKWGLDLQFRPTDSKPFYAKREPIPTTDMNKRYAERVDLFHQSVKDVRLERPRRGTCPRVRTIQRYEDNGEVWTRSEPCPGEVHAVETRINGAIRVDGKCLTCGWELHRAGLFNEREKVA